MKKNIALVAGGDSGEAEISLNGARVVEKNIDKELYNVYPILLNKKKWIYKDKTQTEIPVDKNDFSLTVDGTKIVFDCVFIIIHGTPGENGKLQGYFDLLGMPYTTCDATVSALTFNKNYCKRVVSSYGVLTAKSVHLFKHNPFTIEEILSEITMPCFVKPNNGGSSVGMSKVYKAEEIEAAVNKAFAEDDEILIEEFIKGREITCGVIKADNKVTVLPLTEIISKKDFFDYDAKYIKGMAEEVTPASVSDEVAKKCRETSLRLYNKLNCHGMVRFDYILNDDKLYFLEVNTVPGLSENSIIPKQAGVMGISPGQLYTMIIEDAIKRK